MLEELVRNMTSRSIPIPQPAAVKNRKTEISSERKQEREKGDELGGRPCSRLFHATTTKKKGWSVSSEGWL